MTLPTHSQEILQIISRAPSLLNKEAISSISNYIKSQFCHNGAFMNRHQQPDLYYTLFGLSCAFVLGIELNFDKTENFLLSFAPENLSLVNLASLAKSVTVLAMLNKPQPLFTLKPAILNAVNKFKTANGSYSYDGCGSGFPYAAFLVLNLYQDLSLQPPDGGRLESELINYQCADGKFSNPDSGSTGLILSTAAAVLTIRQLTERINNKALSWLSGQIGTTGGFKADPASPLPDMLSTAVALFTLDICRKSNSAHTARSRQFITDHWHDNGSFTGTLADDQGDCEYTYYGLLALGATCNA